MAVESLVTTGNLILDPLYRLWYSLVGVVPSIILALLILILGYCVAYLIGHLVSLGLDKLGLTARLKKANLMKVAGHTNVPALTGEIVKWFVFVIFLTEAVSVLNLGALSSLLDSFVRWLPNVLVAVVVFFAGVAFVHYLDAKIREHTSMKGMRVISAIVKIIVYFLVIVIGLKQIGVNVDVLQNAFLILVAALGLGVALALGIGLGLGLRGEAEGLLKEAKKHL